MVSGFYPEIMRLSLVLCIFCLFFYGIHYCEIDNLTYLLYILEIHGYRGGLLCCETMKAVDFLPHFPTLPLIILPLFVNMANFSSWAVFIAMLAICFVLGVTTFRTFTVADIIFTWSFSIFAHFYHLSLPALKL